MIIIKNSIVKRWAFSVLSIIVVVIIAIGVVIGIVLQKQYYDAVRLALNSRSSVMVLSSFSTASAVTDEGFNRTARRFVNNFSDKNIMEVWVIDKEGSVVVSSTGFSVEGEKFPDYDYAKTDPQGKGEWIGKMQSGEKVMTLTCMLPENDYGVTGAVRYIISLEDIDNQLIRIWILVAILVFVFILFVIFSGAFFINSIIKPVRSITESAKQISKGDFNVSIEKHKYNDEIGQLGETINNMAREIGETERLKNEFISTVSHELRTPLTAIKGWGETIRYAPKDDTEIIDKGINVIVNESERLTSLVEELLDFSRMEGGKLTLKIDLIDITKELTEVLEVFRERSERDGIDLITEISGGSIKINGDKNRLKQAFVNIIDNSFKYTKRGGYVKVHLECTDKIVKIIISDNGCGISKNDLPKIREKFYKANNSARGSGIGLAVTDEIIKLHNGEMLIDSTVGKGTETTIILSRKGNIRRK